MQVKIFQLFSTDHRVLPPNEFSSSTLQTLSVSFLNIILHSQFKVYLTFCNLKQNVPQQKPSEKLKCV